MGINTNTEDRIIEREGISVRSIFQLTDFENFSGNDITLVEKLYRFKDSVNNGATVYRLLFPQNATTTLTASNRLKDLIISTQPVDSFYITSANAGNLSLFFENLATIYTGVGPTADLFLLTFLPPTSARALGGFSTMEITSAIFRGFNDLGQLVNLEIIVIQDSFMEGYNTGLKLIDAVDILITNSQFVSDFTGNNASIQMEGQIGAVAVNDCGFVLGPGEKAIRIDPAIPDTARVNITNVAVRGVPGATLFDTTGTDGIFTSVSDDSPTSSSITGVAAGSSVNGAIAARFDSAGPILSVDETVTISGFTGDASIYNGTHRVTNVDITFSTFECFNVVFVEDGSGTLDVDRVIVTSNAHGLSEGDSLTISTDDNVDLDGGAHIFSVITNTFSISRTFTATRTGTWSTRGLDQNDPRVLAISNAGFLSSKYIACAFVNDNATVTTISLTNTYQDIDFGTLAATTIMERFKLINQTNGTFAYIGNEPYEGTLTFALSATAGGSGALYKFKFVRSIDGGSTFVDFPDDIEATIDIKTTSTNGSIVLPVVLDTEDLFKLQVKETTGQISITVTDISIYGGST